MTRHPHTRSMNAALGSLVVLQTVMLGALFAQIAPHPPGTTPLFGIAPLIAAGLAAAVAGIVTGGQSKGARILAVLAALVAAVSFGPHKYFDAQFPMIWPAVIAGQVAIVTILYLVFKRRVT